MKRANNPIAVFLVIGFTLVGLLYIAAFGVKALERTNDMGSC